MMCEQFRGVWGHSNAHFYNYNNMLRNNILSAASGNKEYTTCMIC